MSPSGDLALLATVRSTMVRPGLLCLSFGSLTKVPFGGNAPDAMPSVVARKVEPDDSVPNTVIIRLASIDLRFCVEDFDSELCIGEWGSWAAFSVDIKMDVLSRYTPNIVPTKSKCAPFGHGVDGVLFRERLSIVLSVVGGSCSVRNR